MASYLTVRTFAHGALYMKTNIASLLSNISTYILYMYEESIFKSKGQHVVYFQFSCNYNYYSISEFLEDKK